MKRAAAAISAIVLVAVTTLAPSAAQSPNAFGVPSAEQPQPGAAIKAVPGSRAQGWLAQGRSEVLARHGIVATSDPLAAEAGLEILRRGGNAIDAAVATGAVLDVTSQNDTGIGGDLFALVYVAKDKKLYALNSAGWAPAGWTPPAMPCCRSPTARASRSSCRTAFSTSSSRSRWRRNSLSRRMRRSAKSGCRRCPEALNSRGRRSWAPLRWTARRCRSCSIA